MEFVFRFMFDDTLDSSPRHANGAVLWGIMCRLNVGVATTSYRFKANSEVIKETRKAQPGEKSITSLTKL